MPTSATRAPTSTVLVQQAQLPPTTELSTALREVMQSWRDKLPRPIAAQGQLGSFRIISISINPKAVNSKPCYPLSNQASSCIYSSDKAEKP